MAPREDEVRLIDHFTRIVMEKLSRRGFLKGAGAVGLALLGGIGLDIQRAFAYVACPPSSTGICDDCYSFCVSGGKKCGCVCEDCYCDPPTVFAACNWIHPNPDTCIFTCNCIAC